MPFASPNAFAWLKSWRRMFRRRRSPVIDPPAELPPTPAVGPLGTPRAQFWIRPGERVRALGPSPSILVVKLDHIGDFMLSLGAVERLRAVFPGSAVSLLCAPFVADLARGTGLFDAVHTFDFFAERMVVPRRAGEEDVAALRALGLPAFDIIIDFRQEDEARPLLFALDARVRVAFAQPGTAYPLEIGLPEMEVGLRANGWAVPVPAQTRLLLLVEALAAARRGGAAHGGALGENAPAAAHPHVVLAPGSRLAIKRWNHEGWVELARAILERTDLHVSLIGSAEEADATAAIAAALPPGRVHDLAGALDLAEVPAFLISASALVGVDTGTSHMAAALGVPAVVLFSGFADIRVWAPDGPAVRVLHGGAGCAPCLLPELELCPYGQRCMGVISPPDVLAALADLALAAPDHRSGHSSGQLFRLAALAGDAADALVLGAR